MHTLLILYLILSGTITIGIALVYWDDLNKNNQPSPILPWSIWNKYKHEINWFGVLLISLLEIIFIPIIYIPGLIICGLIKLGTRR